MPNQPPQKKPAATDWHPADIVAAVRKAGWSLRRLSIACGYKNPSSLSVAIQKDWPAAEKHIADAIAIPPESIWPERYAKRAARRKT